MARTHTAWNQFASAAGRIVTETATLSPMVDDRRFLHLLESVEVRLLTPSKDSQTGKGRTRRSDSREMRAIERLGRESGLWTTTIRTDTEVLTKHKLEYNAKNLSDFDAVLFYTAGELEMNPEQKAALLSFVRDDGKGFVGAHSATITFTSWPEYGEMIGGYFDEHPWVTFDAPIIVEDPNFPGMQQWPASFVLKDEIYQMKDYSRDKVRVLMRLDASKLDLNNPRVHRKDRDFAVTWAKMYGRGRVYYSTLGHVEQNWDDPRLQKMYLEAIKWAMNLVNAEVTPRPLPTQTGKSGNQRPKIYSGASEPVSESRR